MHGTFKVTRVLCVFTVCCVVSLTSGGQTESKADLQTTITSWIGLVQVPVIVKASGKHIGELKATDFTVEQDGKPQPIRLFKDVHPTAIPRKRVHAGFGNIGTDVATPPQTVIIALDTIHTPPMDQAYCKQELQKFLTDSGGDNSPLALIELTRGGFRVLQDFTTDRKALLAALEKRRPTVQSDNSAKGSAVEKLATEAANWQDLASVGDAEAARRMFATAAVWLESEQQMSRFQDRAARIDTLSALQQLAQTLRGLPGRKALLWVGSGYQFLGGLYEVSRITAITPNTAHLSETLNQHAYTWKLLNDANIAVYPIDARGTVNTAYEVFDASKTNNPLQSQRRMAQQADEETIQTFLATAAETGGKACIYRTDLHNCLREAVEDNSDYYLLGFYLDKTNSRPGWHKITVKVNRKAALRYRSSFLITDPAKHEITATDLQLALFSPFAFTALPFYGSFGEPKRTGATSVVGYEVVLPAESMMIDEDMGKISFDVVCLVRATGGKEVLRSAKRIERALRPGDIAEIKAHGVRYTNNMTLSAGEYGVWFVVRDNLSDRTGSALAALKIP